MTNRLREYARPALVLCLSILVTACASSGEKPTQAQNAAESAIIQAEAANAREFEPVLLNRARNKAADAQELIASEEFDEAEKLLEQATVDAQLAAARAETAQAREAADEIDRSIEQLRQRLNAAQP